MELFVIRLRSAVAIVALVVTSASAQDAMLARVGDRTICMSDFQLAYHDHPGTRDMSTLDGRRSLLFELINKEVLEASALERYPETPEILARSMQIFRESTRRDMVFEILAPEPELRESLLDSLRDAQNVTYAPEGLRVLQSAYRWIPSTDDPIEYLKVRRERPAVNSEEADVLAVSLADFEDWKVQDVIDRLEDMPSGLWPRGDSAEQVVRVLNMLVRGFLLDVVAADLKLESDPEYLARVSPRDRNMRTMLFYHQDVIGDLKSVSPSEVRNYFEANIERYSTPTEYRAQSFSSSNRATLASVRRAWESGVPPKEILSQYSRLDPDLQWSGEVILKEGEHRALDMVLAALKPGEVSDPVDDGALVRIFRMTGVTLPAPAQFEEIRDLVARDALTARQDARLNEFLAEKRRIMNITIEEGLLRNVPGLDPIH